MMVLRYILALLREMFSTIAVMTDGYFCPWRHLKTLVYGAPVNSGEALHHRIVDACQTVRNYPGIFERMRWSMIRRVEACIESHGGHLEHLF
jgi:hypothetical protein